VSVCIRHNIAQERQALFVAEAQIPTFCTPHKAARFFQEDVLALPALASSAAPMKAPIRVHASAAAR
jgi:hypothetical protein